ncbi:uncharacterized protein N7515_000107 [Penicillium bovifimosum]|uniref:SUZ domain-containing protein n=1 Tax=Penicillium bovifimosum TaxID=126998 RepID=A0A9W9HF43_9EURO|nr:uncharacterized protein N7515_000107 [Penicillium bovifimosum]KAJ5145543.1 hypothetical protein N7515_000107 [Penicillium bovifimosum]
MASKSPPGGDGPLSFAKIAAMPAPLNTQSPSISDENEICQPAEQPPCSATGGHGAALSSHNIDKTPEVSSIDLAVHGLERGVQDIDLNMKKDSDGSGSFTNGQDNGSLKRENSFEDDRTHLSTSSTKMTSFDSKSLASVTTFAMDEKDSVRPDDSASVQAIDEDESLSGHVSGTANSMAGSESGSRVFRDQYRDDIPKGSRGILAVPSLFNGAQPANGKIPVDSVANNFVVAANPDGIEDGQTLHGFPLEPDEKLLEAMKSPKDRLLILQLEEKIRYFIKDSEEQSLELPPSNAFGRLLGHKLGDYYHLTHFVDHNVASVRLHRTPFCRLPPPLSDVHAACSITPPTAVPAMKIMRRNDGGQSEDSIGGSSNPSKANSEAGDSGTDGRYGSSSGNTPAKDRMALTREEREAKYHEVRERIFRDFTDSAKSDPAIGDSNPNMSRSSSTTGRKKNQRQRTPHDDSFEVRSQFNAYYPGMQYGSNGPMPYNAPVHETSYQNQVPYLVGPGVPPPSGGYMPSSQNGSFHAGQMNMNMAGAGAPQYPVTMSPQMATNGPWQGNVPQQSPYSGYAAMNQQAAMNQPPSNQSSPAMNNYALPNAMPNAMPYQQPNSNWNSPPFSANFQQSPQQRNGPPVQWPNYSQQSMAPNMPPNMNPNMGPGTGHNMGSNMQSNVGAYPYAQYPGHHMNPAIQNSNGFYATMHYSRSHFNPQTRSFIPGGAPLGRHSNKGQHTMQSYSNMQPGVQQHWNGHADAPSRPMDSNPAGMPNRAHIGTRDSIAKWGTPSHLPAKPPPSEVPSDFDLKTRSVPASVPAPSYGAGANGVPTMNNGPFVVSGGTSVPKPV